jgi:energy-coupling factor transporter ATP-binding protein EcfA2
MKHEAKKGQVLVLTGKQGCGKTTFAREIAKAAGSFEEIHGGQLDSPFYLGNALAKEPCTLIKALSTRTSRLGGDTQDCW